MAHIEKVIQTTKTRVKTKLKRRKQYDKAYKKRVKIVYCTLTLSEYERLAKQALIHGVPPATLIKKSAFAFMDQEVLLPESIKQKIEKILTLTGNIANNLNQIAKHTNTLKKATVFDLMKAKKQIYTLEDAFETFFQNPQSFKD